MTMILSVLGYSDYELPENFTVQDIDDVLKEIVKTNSDNDDILNEIQILVKNDEGNIKEVENYKIDESAKLENKDTILLDYEIPKKVCLKKVFQDRVVKEIPSIIETVYPKMYDISYFRFEPYSKDSMKFLIKAKAKSSYAVDKMPYLNDDIQYILDDMIKYYNNN